MKSSLSDYSFLTIVRNIHIKVFQNNSNIRDDAMRSNLSCLNYLAITTIFIHCIMLLQIGFTEIIPELNFWKNDLLTSHTVLVLYMALAFLMTFKHQKTKKISRWMDH